MKLILYRAKTVNNGVWVSGYYMFSEKTNKHYLVGESEDYGFRREEIDIKTLEFCEVQNETN